MRNYIPLTQSIHQYDVSLIQWLLMSNPDPVGFLLGHATQVDEGVARQRQLLLALQFLRIRSDWSPGIRLKLFHEFC